MNHFTKSINSTNSRNLEKYSIPLYDIHNFVDRLYQIHFESTLQWSVTNLLNVRIIKKEIDTIVEWMNTNNQSEMNLGILCDTLIQKDIIAELRRDIIICCWEYANNREREFLLYKMNHPSWIRRIFCCMC
jgi:hypothetical protein